VEEIRTKKSVEINSNILKAEMKAVMLRSVTDRYQTFYKTFMKHDLNAENNENENGKIIEAGQNLIRYRAALTSNL
jgi:hypothetical protein